VTGFGILGHALEMARGSKVALIINADELPLLSEAQRLAQERFITGASTRNWMSYNDSVTLPPEFPEWRRHLLTDPQTSGGLLIACHPDRAATMLKTIVGASCPHARIIGHVQTGTPFVEVRA
jgi:selenide, water dikinase